MKRLTEDQGNVLVHALYSAARTYDECAHTSSCTPGHSRLANSFQRQAVDARALAELIEQAGSIVLGEDE